MELAGAVKETLFYLLLEILLVVGRKTRLIDDLDGDLLIGSLVNSGSHNAKGSGAWTIMSPQITKSSGYAPRISRSL